MDLHYDTGRDRKLGLGGLAYGVAAAPLGALLGLILGGPLFVFAMVILWGTGAVAALAGIIVLTGSLRPLRIRLDEAGLQVHGRGHDLTLGWGQVEAISIEQTPPAGDPPTSQDVLVLWVADSVAMKQPPQFPASGAGPKGHLLVDVADLTETRDQVEQALRQFAGHRFRSLSAA